MGKATRSRVITGPPRPCRSCRRPFTPDTISGTKRNSGPTLCALCRSTAKKEKSRKRKTKA